MQAAAADTERRQTQADGAPAVSRWPDPVPLLEQSRFASHDGTLPLAAEAVCAAVLRAGPELLLMQRNVEGAAIAGACRAGRAARMKTRRKGPRGTCWSSCDFMPRSS